MYGILKRLLFLIPPESAHQLTVSVFSILLKIPILSTLIRGTFTVSDVRLERNVCGLNFPNPVGLAAGFDKDGKYIKTMHALGFGSIEVGTVTPRPQAGNPKPRLFRLPKDNALINRMGFNNNGVDALAGRLQNYRKNNPASSLIIGGNIGKNKTTPNESAQDDYIDCFRKLHPHVDYFTVNVSSPNTPNLRALQQIEPLKNLLVALQDENQRNEVLRPIFLKIAPDMSEEHLKEIVDLAISIDLDGIIATNTTISRDNLETSDTEIQEIGAGGLSGDPVRKRSTEVIQFIRQQAGDTLNIIGVGGIRKPEDAIQKLNAGANLLQVYSGMIYAGPGLVKRINREIMSKVRS
jgi:dihydroorotate dehydrogenase